ncbi:MULTISPECIES: alpha/beta hydrolase [unclassified Methylobacterium]|uniref:alpha/beta fold hydrolase n=1 Tax=unclassified Methylobacterium TaxID=2615210 RepID=UPI00226A801B|nr:MULTISPECIES: alpha/beta hydrolase [unclassified Methylobacterium]
MKRFRTGVLDVGYNEGGPPDGPPVLVLHGWPDDPSGMVSVQQHLHDAGLRTIAPWLRGFGGTQFLSNETLRDGRALVLAQDAIDLLNGLGIERCTVIGHDWGGRAAYNLAALIPDRLEMIAVLAIGYAPFGRFETPDFKQARRWWYQWYMNADGGAERVRADPIGFARAQWVSWSPAGWYEEAAFVRAAESFLNPDWVAITLHGYRSRWLPEAVDERYAGVDQTIARTGKLRVPTLMIQGDADACDPPSAPADDARWFENRYERLVLTAVGHFPPREEPDAVARAILRFRQETLRA